MLLLAVFQTLQILPLVELQLILRKKTNSNTWMLSKNNHMHHLPGGGKIPISVKIIDSSLLLVAPKGRYGTADFISHYNVSIQS